MEYCFFDKANPPKYDYDFYKTGIYVKGFDHFNNYAHNLLMQVAAGLLKYLLRFKSNEIKKIIDLGCGNGGFLKYVIDDKREWVGYDLCKANCELAVKKFENRGNVKIIYKDFLECDINADLIIITEVLEHLINPHDLLKKINSKYILASIPLGETPEKRVGRGKNRIHLWGWDEQGFKDLFINNNWKIKTYTICFGCIGQRQYIIAVREIE